MKTMTILGSTGSIGTQALEVAAKHNIKVKALAANSDVEKLAAQAKELMPERVCIYREDKKSELEKLLSGTGIKISTGMEGLKEIARMDGVDIMLNSVVGMVGLVPTLTAIEKGTDIADCSNLDIRPYIDNMPTCMAAADLVICRAGAITLSEIQAMGKPAILIPSPNVAENHQYHNAMALVNAGAADIIEEKDLTGAALMRKTDKMLLNPEKLEKYSENSRKMAITDANERIYSVVKKVLVLV